MRLDLVGVQETKLRDDVNKLLGRENTAVGIGAGKKRGTEKCMEGRCSRGINC